MQHLSTAAVPGCEGQQKRTFAVRACRVPVVRDCGDGTFAAHPKAGVSARGWSTLLNLGRACRSPVNCCTMPLGPGTCETVSRKTRRCRGASGLHDVRATGSCHPDYAEGSAGSASETARTCSGCHDRRKPWVVETES